MRGGKKLRGAMLRWDSLMTVVVLGLPFLATCLLGFLWLFQQSLLLEFIVASGVLGALVYCFRALPRLYWRRQTSDDGDAEGPGVEADPDWLPREKEIFRQACERIENITETVQPWESMQDHALNVVKEVALLFNKKKQNALSITVPEVLLLVERSASRYRDYLRTKVPFSDQVSVATMHWVWLQRNRATLLWKLAHGGGRVARFALNPTTAAMREIEQMIAGGNSSYLTEQMMRTMQAVLLEEVAHAAVELYSGRLRFSDAELLQIQLASTAADRERVAQPDSPLRILFIGQISAGKSTLINALLDSDLTETDAAPTTPGLTVYETEIDGIPCHFLDSRGLDGSQESQDAMLAEMIQADMIVWTIRADRPARAPDLALKQSFDAWFEERPLRRKPQIVAAATGMDRLAPGWPFPENVLPDAVQQTFSAAVNAIAEDMGGLKPRPVVSVPPPWNTDGVSSAIHVALGEALLTQRNRRRIEAGKKSRGLMKEAKRSARGVLSGTKVIGGRLGKKPGGTSGT